MYQEKLWPYNLLYTVTAEGVGSVPIGQRGCQSVSDIQIFVIV